MTESIERRIFMDAYENVQTNNEYVKRIDRIIEIGQNIMEHLNPYEKTMFLEYENQISMAYMIYLKNVYFVGLEDGYRRALQSIIMPNKMPNRNLINRFTVLK